MILSIAVIVFVLFVAYIWTSHGLFSALLHFVCTLAAGAVAFALWEPIVYGALLNVREDIAWSLGLAVPFLVSLLVFRLLTDRLIPANLDVSNTANSVGGGAFGGLSAIITAGVLVISIGFFRLPPDFLGYKPVAYDQGTGNVVQGSPLWLPVDTITTRLYERLSVGSFSAGDSALARRNPDVHLQAGMVRMANNGNRVALKPGDLKILGTYEVNGSPQELLADSFTFDQQTGRSIVQQVHDFSGEPVSGSSKIWGVAIEFLSGAREDTGQTVIGPGQIRLLATSGDELVSANPIAVISRADGTTLQAGRWRFDAPGVFVASVGAGSSATMTFEFLVPADAVPVDLLVKNVRVPADRLTPLPGAPEDGYSVEDRDMAIRTLELLGMEPVTPGQAAAPSPGPASSASGDAPSGGSVLVDGAAMAALRENGVFIGSQLITGPILKARAGGLRLDSQNAIISGEISVSKADLGNRRTGSADLQVDRFAATPDVVVVQVDVSLRYRSSPYGRALSAAERVAAILLHDTIGQAYEPVGFIHDDSRDITIRYEPGAPIRALSQVPTLSRTSQSDQLVLVFQVSRGVDISRLTLGNTVLVEFNPPAPTARAN